jgi:AcrR family transcriptional regulator
MPYPSKTNAQTILHEAVRQVECSGLPNLNMRALAARLDITPRALYRYFPDRTALETAIAEARLHRLSQDIERSIRKKKGRDALVASAQAYLGFARSSRHLYAVTMMELRETESLARAGHALWALVVGHAEILTGPSLAQQAALALWAFLHGFAQLEEKLGKAKPKDGFNVGLEGLLSGLTGMGGGDKAKSAADRSRATHSAHSSKRRFR